MESKISINSTDTKFTQTSNDQRFLLTQSKWSTENEADKQLENLKKSIKRPNSISSIYSVEDFEKRNLNYNILPNLFQASNLYEIIKSNYLMKVNAQVRFETSRGVDKRIGRPSNCKLETSSQINNGFVTYLEQKLMQLVTDHSRWFRRDQLNSEYFRIVKKSPYYFIENWSTKALYKETDISNWVKSYIEAASAFHFSQRNYSKINWVERVVEFSVIFFSKAKWSKLISELMSYESSNFRKYLETQKKKFLKLEVACQHIILPRSLNYHELWDHSLKSLLKFLVVLILELRITYEIKRESWSMIIYQSILKM